MPSPCHTVGCLAPARWRFRPPWTTVLMDACTRHFTLLVMDVPLTEIVLLPASILRPTERPEAR